LNGGNLAIHGTRQAVNYMTDRFKPKLTKEEKKNRVLMSGSSNISEIVEISVKLDRDVYQGKEIWPLETRDWVKYHVGQLKWRGRRVLKYRFRKCDQG